MIEMFTWMLLNAAVYAAELVDGIDASKPQEWIISSVSMPRPGDGMAVGSYNDSIYLLGGFQYQHQLIRYDINANKIIDLGANHFPSSANIFGDGQFYSVKNNIIYMIDHDPAADRQPIPDTIATFNTKTLTFTKYWNHINISYPVGPGACIAVDDSFLYIVGGSNYLQMFSLKTNKWIHNVPPMYENRNYLTCNIYSETNTLYAIGGFAPSRDGPVEYLDTVEYIIINNDMHATSWKPLNGRLLYPTESARSVIFETSIFVTGGQYYDQHQNRQYISVIQIIDIPTGQIRNGGKLAQSIENTATIFDNGVIYAFGGYYSSPLKLWQYCRLITPTKSPTHSPTKTPTYSPTSAPTKTPTHSPSNTPTLSPSMIPTVHISPTHSASVLVPVLSLIIIFCGVSLFYIWIRRRYARQMKQIINVNSKEKDTKDLFKVLGTIPTHIKSVSSKDSNYVPMKTIEENSELKKNHMREHDIVHSLVFEEEFGFQKRTKDKKEKKVVFRGAR